ncbi:MAG: hypothetical protein ABIH47_03860 [Candidatus Omnitrophota bacterium]
MNFLGKKILISIYAFLPFPLEDLDDLDLDELGEEGLNAVGKKDNDSDDLKFEINSHDVDFLRKYGMKF